MPWERLPTRMGRKRKEDSMTKPFFKSMTVLMAVVLLVTTLSAPAMANQGGDGKGNDLVRAVYIFAGLGKVVARGNTSAAALMEAHQYVRNQIRALTILTFTGPLVLQTLMGFTGKRNWTDPAYMAVFGVFYRQIMMDYQSAFTQALFTVWCMFIYLMATATGIFAASE